MVVLLVLLVTAMPGFGETAHEPDAAALPGPATTGHVLELPGRTLRFTATAGSLRLSKAANAALADVAFVAYRAADADVQKRPVVFVFNGGPGIASAWLQVGAIGPWRIDIDPQSQGPSASPQPAPNADTWLDFADLVFIDPPGTGYSRILATDADARRRLWSVDGDIDALAEAVRRWLDDNKRSASPKYILGESYGGFRAPRLARALAADQGVGISGLILLSPLLDAHGESGLVDPIGWADLLPSEAAVVRARKGPVTRGDMADVEAYAVGDYLTDMLRGEGDRAAIDRLTAKVAALTGLDPAAVRRMRGRVDADAFQRLEQPNRVASIYDGTVTRPDPAPRDLAGRFPDPILAGLAAPVSSAMMILYADKLNWHPGTVYRLINDAVFAAWDWGRGIGRPESLTALESARSLDPQLRVLIAHGLFDLRTPYFASVRMLRLLPELDGVPPVVLRAYPGGHMFYFDGASRAALREDVRAMFDRR